MNSISIDIASWKTTEKPLEKYPTLTRENLLKYRIQLNDLLDNPKATDKQVEDYIANLDNNYQK